MAQQGPSVPKFHCSGCKQWLESSDPTKKRKKAVVLLVEFNLKKIINLQCALTLDGDLTSSGVVGSCQ